MPEWLIDTSAWARRELGPVKKELKKLIADDGELLLSPVVLLEALQGPQGEDVAKLHKTLTDSMRIVGVTDETCALGADATVRLAEHKPEAHRVPPPDLITAALAHQHQVGVVHCDDHFKLLAKRSGLKFEQHPIPVPTPAGAHPQAGEQRRLKAELFQLLHQMNVADAEAFLAKAVEDAQQQLGT